MIMENVNFGNEVLSKGAILGVLMLASNLVEQSAMIYGGTIGWMSFVGVESIAVTVVYIWLLYRFAKNYSLAVYESRRDPKYFSYGEGLGYVVSVAVLAGVIVAAGGYLFRHFAIGYDNYIAGYMQMMQNVLASSQIPASMESVYEQLFSQLESQSEPSLIKTVFSGAWSYLFSGLLLGLIIAAVIKRAPKLFGDELDDAE